MTVVNKYQCDVCGAIKDSYQVFALYWNNGELTLLDDASESTNKHICIKCTQAIGVKAQQENEGSP